MTEESKIAVPPEEGAPATNAPPTATVANESEGDDAAEDAADDAPSTAVTAAKKTKKTKRKKVKDALTGKSAIDPKVDLKGAIADLPPEQLKEFLKLNPALAQELEDAKAQGSGESSSSSTSLVTALKNLSLHDIMTGLATSGKNVKDMSSYKFWSTQPVPRFDQTSKNLPEGPLKQQNVEDVPKEPAPLLDGFEWDTVDITDTAQLKEVYELLSGHFVEDDSATFRFRYSPSILKWALMSPGWTMDWHVGVRASQSKKLVAFISAIPMDIRVRTRLVHASEVNFLVIHKKLRSKRLAPVLIKEITRRSNLKEVWQGIYTAGIVLPKPISTCRYFHRSIHWQKLYETGFSPLPPNSKPQAQIRKYYVPDSTEVKGLREMKLEDVPAVQKLFAEYSKRWDMALQMNEEEIRHWFFDRKEPGDDRVIFSYVVEDSKKKITDFFSFYSLDSTVIDNPRHKSIRVAYLFYYATEVGIPEPFNKPAVKERLTALMQDALVLAKRFKFDVFNALSIMDNALFLDQLKFGAGDGQLHYYLFNYYADPIGGGVDKRNKLDQENLSGVGLTMM